MNVTKIKRPSISSGRKIDELFDFLWDNDMEILASGHPDYRLTIRIGENFYTCINSQMIPPHLTILIYLNLIVKVWL